MLPFSISLPLLTRTSAFVKSPLALALKAFTPGNTLNKGVAVKREKKRAGGRAGTKERGKC